MRNLVLICGFYLGATAAVFSDAASDSNPSPSQPVPEASTTAATAPQLIMDRPGDWGAIKTNAYQDLSTGNYDKLEATERTMRTSDSRFPEGTARLVPFYSALNSPWGKGEDAWNKHFALLDAWRKAKPDSVVAAAAYAATLNSYAWDARGSGESGTVTDQGWKLFGERLDQSRKILEDAYTAHHGKDIPPSWYSALQTVALGQGWSHAEYDRWFDEAVAAYPDYESFYFSKAYFLLPRWYGEEGEAEQFAEDCGKKYGPALYTRILWSMNYLFAEDDFFKETGARWDLMKAGFEELEKKWPTSLWNLNAFCHFAVLAKDKPTAKRLFEKIGPNFYTDVWGTPVKYMSDQSWANTTP